MIDVKIHRKAVFGEPVKTGPYPKQAEILKAILEPPYDFVPRRINLMCGWGFGKSLLGIDAAQCMLQMGLNGVFLEPNVILMETVFLSMWQELIPPELYKLQKKTGWGIITWLPTGAKLIYTHRAITASLEQTLNKLQGWTLSFYVDDEAATGCNYAVHTSLRARLRARTPFIRYITLSTPKMGEYGRIIEEDGSILFRGQSEDNPFIPREILADWRSHMSLAQQRRDLDGELVALEDMLWHMCDLEHSWPRGNVDDLHPRFNPGMPWWLCSDFGSATGSDVIIQQVPRSIGMEPRWAIVADLCPAFDASVRRRWKKLQRSFGYPPSGIAAGRDVNTRGLTDGATAAYFAQKIWGSVSIYPSNEDKGSKQRAYDMASYMFSAPNGDRRLTVARDLVDQLSTAVLDPDSKRGILQMIQQDVWLPEDERNQTDYLPKGRKIRVSHVRDSLLMGTEQIMRPPTWAGDSDRKYPKT